MQIYIILTDGQKKWDFALLPAFSYLCPDGNILRLSLGIVYDLSLAGALPDERSRKDDPKNIKV